jgi:lysine-N-methylase
VVYVTDEERQRILAQGWEQEPELQGLELFERVNESEGWRLRHRADGSCVFLDADHRCRIHARFGLEAKPFACRLYPFVLMPHGGHWQLGLRFSCPPVAWNTGRPLSEHLTEVRALAGVLEKRQQGLPEPRPPLNGAQSLSWADIERVVQALDRLLAADSFPLEQRWRQMLYLVGMLREARFDGGGDVRRAVTGKRLNELLQVLSAAAQSETPPADQLPAPSRKGRLLFRSLLAVYVRKDSGPERGTAQRTVWGRLAAAWRFAQGKGRIPRLHACLPEHADFQHAEHPWPRHTEGLNPALALLERWSRAKLLSLQFCGPGNFGLNLWQGIESLLLAAVAVLWLGRVLHAQGQAVVDAMVRAVRTVDDNFGFNQLLGGRRQRWILQLLRPGDELGRLISWYSRGLDNDRVVSTSSPAI